MAILMGRKYDCGLYIGKQLRQTYNYGNEHKKSFKF